ncbi:MULTISPECIES: hypothetical protein [Enterococcus]
MNNLKYRKTLDVNKNGFVHYPTDRCDIYFNKEKYLSF